MRIIYSKMEMSNKQLALNGIEQLNHQTLLKWPGNKTQLVKQISLCISKFEKFDNYYEPFFGSGALYFYLKKNNIITRRSYLNDYLEELITFYKVIKNPKKNIEIVKKIISIINKYNSLTDLLQKKQMYLELREKYNWLLTIRELSKSQEIEQSALLYFLNKTCFNGVYRKSKKGVFNVPHGRRVGNSQKINFGEQNIQYFQNTKKLLRNTELTSIHYKFALKSATSKDFVYLDPPYVGNFTDYTSEGFKENDFMELNNTINDLLDKKINFLMSNSNTTKTLEIFYDKRLYCYQLDVTRTIDRSNTMSDGATTELLISNNELKFLGRSIW